MVYRVTLLGVATEGKRETDAEGDHAEEDDQRHEERSRRHEEAGEGSGKEGRDEDDDVELDDDDIAAAVNEEMGDEPAADTEPISRKVHHLPSKAAQRKHELTHIPFRPWCRVCVAARKPNWSHWVDHCFFRNRPGEDSVPTLVMKDRESLALAAHVVPYKGGDNEWTVKQAARDLRRWGIRGDLTLRSDQERALVDFCGELAKQRQDGANVRTFLENNGVGESQSNGCIESGVKAVEGMVRTFKFALEERIQSGIKVDELVFMWLLEHAADLVNKFQVGQRA